MIGTGIVKVISSGCLALFGLLVAFNNLIDYNSNFDFVHHMTSMDATLLGSGLLQRRARSPARRHLSRSPAIA